MSVFSVQQYEKELIIVIDEWQQTFTGDYFFLYLGRQSSIETSVSNLNIRKRFRESYSKCLIKNNFQIFLTHHYRLAGR